MRKNISKFTFILIVLVGIILVGCSSDNDGDASSKNQVQSLSIATSGSGSGAYLTGGVMASQLNDKQDVFQLSSQVTSGYGENPILVNSGSADIGMLMELSLDDAYYGEGEFTEANENIRTLFNFNLFFGHAITKADSDINGVGDIIGKSVNLGEPAQITRTLNDYLMDSLGIDTASDINLQQLSTGDGFAALQDGIIDATFNMGGLGAANIIELATTIDVKFLNFSDDEFNAFNEAADNKLIRSTVPADTYVGLDEDLETWAAGVVLIANKDVDEDAIYEFTKQFWENIESLKEEDGSFEGINIDDHGITSSETPIHPGAERYFKEIGLIE